MLDDDLRANRHRVDMVRCGGQASGRILELLAIASLCHTWVYVNETRPGGQPGHANSGGHTNV